MDKEIKNFTYQDIISFVFIGASILNIIASDKEKEYLISKNKDDLKVAYDIYIWVLIILIILYLYFVKVNYQVYKDASLKEKKASYISLIGNIFFLIGGLCFLYSRICNKNQIQNEVEL